MPALSGRGGSAAEAGCGWPESGASDGSLCVTRSFLWGRQSGERRPRGRCLSSSSRPGAPGAARADRVCTMALRAHSPAGLGSYRKDLAAGQRTGFVRVPQRGGKRERQNSRKAAPAVTRGAGEATFFGRFRRCARRTCRGAAGRENVARLCPGLTRRPLPCRTPTVARRGLCHGGTAATPPWPRGRGLVRNAEEPRPEAR